MREWITTGFGLGTHSQLLPDLIPQQAAQSESNWVSSDGINELVRGRFLVGARETGTSFVTGLHFGYKANGTSVMFEKINTVIRYYNGTAWINVVTGLTAGAEYTFSNYASLAGNFVYATGSDGIYKIMTANPGNFASMYDPAKNFKGYSLINDSRMIMWNLPNDTTGLYGSWVDRQDSTVYTTVTAEATISLSGTLAFKAGDAKRTCFGVSITLTGSGEVYTDDYVGILTGSLGGTGTINYMTGAYTLSNPGTGTANYRWEMTNNKGVTDFTKSAPRLAGEGFMFRQDLGGDAIQNVLIQDGKYYSYKLRSVYELNLTADDTNATNIVFRRDIGLPYWRACWSTSDGMVYLDNSNPNKPRLAILQKNVVGDNLTPYFLAEQFNFSAYTWDACAVTTYGENIVFNGRTSDSATNNKLFIYNKRRNSLDVETFSSKVWAKDDGILYSGDSLSENVYKTLNGFDDDGYKIDNFWIGKDDNFTEERLKKYKWLYVKGLITTSQALQVWVKYDNSNFTLVGTVVGNGPYVDSGQVVTIGSSGIGVNEIGGGGEVVTGSPYFTALKINTPKFRVRTIMFIATGIGYVNFQLIKDHNIMLFANKLPAKYMIKQNVSLDGQQSDL